MIMILLLASQANVYLLETFLRLFSQAKLRLQGKRSLLRFTDVIVISLEPAQARRSVSEVAID